LRIDIPSGRHNAGRDELGADIALAEVFFVHNQSARFSLMPGMCARDLSVYPGPRSTFAARKTDSPAVGRSNRVLLPALSPPQNKNYRVYITPAVALGQGWKREEKGEAGAFGKWFLDWGYSGG
jgi:hypothetical protein